ncbi:MAG: hypothetical protein HKO05_06495 [Erythrobacter sp.]|jgi:hypothetical protein|nr:hypothetical protein [Erythrobacter sp.]RZV32015.1 MAG: hypothetical protein EX262_08160 [Sphingomonadaceae bacterium]
MADIHPKLTHVDLDRSFILGVIYDDKSLTLEMEFRLESGHPDFAEPEEGEDGCFKQGFVRFSDLEDLRLRKTKVEEGKEQDFSEIFSATIAEDYAHVDSGWGEIELTAGSIRVAFD